MGSPAEKPDPPKTKEEAGQPAVDARYRVLEKIADSQQRAKAESLIRSCAEEDFAAIGNAVERAKASQAQWEQKRESLSEKPRSGSPGSASTRPSSGVRMPQIGGMVLKSARKQADTITRAQEASAAYRERQQIAKDRER